MHPSIPLVLCLVALVALTSAGQYDDKYDNIDLRGILTNDRLYQRYYNCISGVDKCTPDGQYAKDVIPDALTNGCSKCTEKQKKGAEDAIRYLVKNKPQDWAVLQQKYDPTGKFSAKYKDDLKNIKSS